MQCHLEPTSTALPSIVRRFNRGPFSYVPGQPLSDFALYFDHAPGTGYDDKFEIAGAAYRFRKSRCVIESKGAFTCQTCHNPHDLPRGEQATSDIQLFACNAMRRDAETRGVGQHRAAASDA